MTSPSTPSTTGRHPLLLIRADGGRLQGSGHVMRSLAVAEAWRQRGLRVVLSADLEDLQWLRPWVDDLVDELVPALSTPGELAAEAANSSATVVLLDHYGFTDARSQVNAVGAILVNFEDGEWGRRPADIVIDYSLGAEELTRPNDTSPVLLAGVSYAPMRQQVRDARSGRARFSGDVGEVAVLMGGTDPLGLRDRTSGVLAQLGLKVTAAPPGLDFLDHVARADAVITAAGSSAYELCCLGMPIGLVQVADNQRVNYTRLVDAGAATPLGVGTDIAADVSSLAARINDWLADPLKLASTATAARALLDGNGADRIAKQIAERVAADTSD